MENLKIIRSKLNKTQYQVSKALGISRSSYNAYELGTRKPTPEMLTKIANYYNVSIDYLVMGKEDQKSASEKAYIQQLFDILSTTSQAQAIRLLEAMAIREYNTIDIMDIIRK